MMLKRSTRRASLPWHWRRRGVCRTRMCLRVGYTAYLNGMGEAVGEMRRHILDTLRKGDVEECERKLEHIDAIYTALTTIDFPDGITSGLRRTTDMVRGVVERTRGDLTVAVRQHQLERSLRRLEERLKG